MDTLAEFGKIAEFLKHPLVLMGFVLMLVFSIHKLVLNAGIVPQLNQKQGSVVVTLLLRYGFWLGVLMMVLGFGLQFYQAYADTQIKTSSQTAAMTADIKQIVTTLTNKHQQDLQGKDEQLKSLTQAVTAISTGQDLNAKQSERNAALNALAKGNTTLAKTLFAKTAEKAEAHAKQGAQALRNLGALAYLDNTQEALQTYRRATQLDPDTADGWNQLGRLLRRVGDLEAAIAAYSKVLALGENHHNQQEISAAYGNLGIVYQTRGDLDKAIAFYQKSLAIEESLGHKEGMAIQYGNLGIAYQTRDNLGKAIEFYQKALSLDESLGNKVGMATDYGNLGNVYQTLDDLETAHAFYQKSLAIEESLGHKEGMAIQYGNLGLVYKTRGDLDKAIAFYQKALSLNESLSRKEGMAINNFNLGIVYKTRSNNTEAKRYYQLSLELFKQLGSPKAQKVQASLDAL